jgi:hypothetical protein
VGDATARRKSPEYGAFAGTGGKDGKKLPVGGSALPPVGEAAGTNSA